MTVREIAVAVGGRLHPEGLDPDTAVTGPVVIDSRLVVAGALFVALPGENTDGHDFVPAAVRAGASVVLVTRPMDVDGEPAPSIIVDDVEKALGDLARVALVRLRELGDLQVIGITGSVGKTTTKDVLAQVLAGTGRTVAPVLSFNNEIGLPLTVLRADAETRFLVLEMGASGAGHLEYLTSLAPPDLAVVLKVGSAHLGEFGGIEAVAMAKAEIVLGLAPGGVAVLNGDDERVEAMAGLAPGRIVRFGELPGTDVRALEPRLDTLGRAAFTLTSGTDSAPVQLALVGEHHVHNALAVAAVALELGVSLADVAERLARAGALSPHRMHVVDRADGVTILDDSYNANPDSMRAALKSLAVLAGRSRRSVAVLGEMLELGPDAREAHDAIGQLVVRFNVGLTVVVGEGARAIRDGANREGSWGDEVALVDDIDAAEQLLADELAPGDVVLVKSSYGSGLWKLADRLTWESRS